MGGMGGRDKGGNERQDEADRLERGDRTREVGKGGRQRRREHEAERRSRNRSRPYHVAVKRKY